MPCRDWDDADPRGLANHYRKEDQDKIDRLTRWLCFLCGNLDSCQERDLPKDLKMWWVNHQEQDRKRREREAEQEAASREKRRRAYLKLKKEFEG